MTIITTKKPFEEVLMAIKDTKKIGIVSCGSCAAMCQTGGEEGAKEMADKLHRLMSNKDDKVALADLLREMKKSDYL